MTIVIRFDRNALFRNALAERGMGMKDLAGKTAFVTGAASGIGLGIATAFAQAGVKVMLCDIEEAAAAATIARYGKVHILVNNAGVGGAGPYGAWTDKGWDWTIGVNLMAVVWGVEIFGPLLEQHGEGGHIVSTASIAGLISRDSTPYNATKYGVVALSEGLRFELAPRGIGVSVLCPGFIRTRIVDSRRNLPPRFGRTIDDASVPERFQEFVKMIKDRIAPGIDPAYVGELVREGVENDWPYIFTDTEFEPVIEARFATIKRGFDRI